MSIPRQLILIMTALIVLSASGCMTLISQQPYWEGTRLDGHNDAYFLLRVQHWYPYGGTVNDIALFLEVPVLTWIDLPLSLVADTAILPLTIYQQFRGTPIRKPETYED